MRERTTLGLSWVQTRATRTTPTKKTGSGEQQRLALIIEAARAVC
jgi:hypothetical protein